MELTSFSVVDFGMTLWRVFLALMICVARGRGLECCCWRQSSYPEIRDHRENLAFTLIPVIVKLM